MAKKKLFKHELKRSNLAKTTRKNTINYLWLNFVKPDFAHK